MFRCILKTRVTRSSIQPSPRRDSGLIASNRYLSPYFPDMSSVDSMFTRGFPILITPGVNQVVGAGKTPTVVDEAELSAIRRVMQSGVAAQPWPYLRVGETVQIENGPLEGMTGIVTRIKNSCRLVVSVSLLMRSVSVELDSHWIKPVSSPARAPEGAITEHKHPGRPSCGEPESVLVTSCLKHVSSSR